MTGDRNGTVKILSQCLGDSKTPDITKIAACEALGKCMPQGGVETILRRVLGDSRASGSVKTAAAKALSRRN
jgi:hypothetical protein